LITQELIVKSWQVFKKYGVRSISMDDIARELSISKKTLYKFVRNKSELLEKVFENQNNIIDLIFEKNRQERANAIDVLFGVSTDVIKLLSEANPVLTYDLQKYYPDICKMHLDAKRQKTYEKIKQNIEDGIKEGLYREDIELEATAMLYVQNMENLMNTEFLFSKTFLPSDLFKVMFENHIRAIANAIGLEYFNKRLKETEVKI